MTDVWIPIVLVAAALQTVRNAGQKKLGTLISVWPATWVRFLFGLPVAIACLLVVKHLNGGPLPELPTSYLVLCALAAISQVIGTALLIILFSMRNFAVGSTYVRTETIISAVVGVIFFAEALDLAGWIAVLVSTLGVVVISLVKQGITGFALLRSGLNLAAGLGLGCGLGFSLASFSIRQASHSLELSDPFYAAAITLVVVIVIQTTGMGIYVLATRPREVLTIFRAWPVAVLVGVTSGLGSMGWFTAMTLQKVAYVKALAQVEFLFALAVSILFFRERSTPREMFGMALVAAGIVILVLFAR
jgi:drug/metabolite transporter (DMT)-like permease